MLRPYQETAIQRMLWSLTIAGNSVISLPVGAGKTHVIAEFVKRLNAPMLIFVASKELLEQDLEKLKAVVPAEEIGIFSASMHTKEIKRYTLATIQSAYKHPELFNHYTVAIIDECSQVNPKKLDGMYNKFFQQIGNPKIIGLDATCFRLDSFYRPTFRRWQPWETVTTTKVITRYKSQFWKQIIYVVNTHELIEQGYLCPMEYHDMSFYYHEDIPTNKSASDFDLQAFEDLIGDKEPYIANHIVQSFEKHKSILVFCSSVSQAERLSKTITGAQMVSAKTPAKERETIIEEFRRGTVKVVFNVGVLTRGFDHPALDCIYMVRPTRSINLYVQMLGRGTRLFPGKTTCTVYDFSGNIKSIGTLESVKLEKVMGLWNVVTTKLPEGAHMKPLYTFAPRKTTQQQEWENK